MSSRSKTLLSLMSSGRSTEMVSRCKARVLGPPYKNSPDARVADKTSGRIHALVLSGEPLRQSAHGKKIVEWVMGRHDDDSNA